MDHDGLLSLLPTLVVVVLATLTRRTFESLLAGVLCGCLLVQPQGPFSAFTTNLLEVMRDETIGWIILVCGLFGSLTVLLVKSGGANRFASFLGRFVRGRRSALLITWLLGVVLFVDDYLNALTIGTTMKPVTDKYRISREMLAYVVDSTAAPVCVLLPFSTWAIYVAGLLETNGVASEAAGLTYYVSAIPFVVYGWIAILMVPAVAAGWIPPLGPMKAAEARAQAGQVAPPGSESIAMEIEVNADFDQTKMRPSTLWHFVLPIAILIAATVWFEVDALKGVIVAVLFTVCFYGLTRVMSLADAVDNAFEGFKLMVFPLSIIVLSFLLKAFNDELGLTQFIIESVSPLLNRATLPALAFLSLSLITFATGSFWGVYAISIPIIVPLAQETDANLPLVIGAIISSGAFGSHACFYGDATILSASASGCNNIAHVTSQLPYALLAGCLTMGIYLALGLL